MDSLKLQGHPSLLQGRAGDYELYLQTRVKVRQAEIMRALLPPSVLPQIHQLLVTKLGVTLGIAQFQEICFFLGDFNWLPPLLSVLHDVEIHTRMVWFKTVCGAWTTSHRMHEDRQLQCLFGCQDCKDTLRHYLYCPVIWQIAREVCPFEESSSLAVRLGMTSPSKQALNRLAIVFGIYHSVKNDHFNSIGVYNCTVQSRAVGFVRAVASHVLTN